MNHDQDNLSEAVLGEPLLTMKSEYNNINHYGVYSDNFSAHEMITLGGSLNDSAVIAVDDIIRKMVYGGCYGY